MSHALIVMLCLYKGMEIVYFMLLQNCMDNTEDRHSIMRLSIGNKIINEWDYYKVLSWICQWLTPLKITNLYSLEIKECGGSVELT